MSGGFFNKGHDGSGLTAAEILFVQTANAGVLLLAETTAPSATANIGKVYVKSSDSKIYFKDDSGVEYDLTAGASGANTALSNLSAVSINTSLLAQTGVDLGSTTKQFRDLYLFGAGTYATTYLKLTGTPTSTRTLTIPDATDTFGLLAASQAFTNKSYNGMTLTSTTGTFTLTAAKTFAVTNTLTLSGTDSTVMTFPSTSATIARTDAANTFTGASTASAWVLTSPTITTKISPTSDDGAPLGDTTHNFSDLFLATGALINIANSNWVATHSSGILTVTTGDLRVTSANVGTNADSVPTLSSTSTFTNKTFTTPVINGAITGTGQASAATASTIMMRDANINSAINNLVEGFTTTATAAGTTTLTITATYTQVWTGATTQTVKLPTTSVLQGQQYFFVNLSSGAVTVQSSGANTITIMAAGTSCFFTAVVATPTTAANWNSAYAAANVASGKVATINNTITFAGTDATTMTFPTTSATIARTDAANTFTGIQTMTSPAITTANLTGTQLLAENASIGLDPAGSADGKYTGITVTATAGYTQAFGDLVYLAVADSRWELADADASATAGPVALAMVVVAGTDGNACTLLLQGIIRADAKFPTMTVGATQFVGETAGAIQGAIPTGADNIIRTVGYAITADELYFNPSTDWQVTVA